MRSWGNYPRQPCNCFALAMGPCLTWNPNSPQKELLLDMCPFLGSAFGEVEGTRSGEQTPIHVKYQVPPLCSRRPVETATSPAIHVKHTFWSLGSFGNIGGPGDYETARSTRAINFVPRPQVGTLPVLVGRRRVSDCRGLLQQQEDKTIYFSHVTEVP